MINKSQKNETQKLISYILIGIVTALITFILTGIFNNIFILTVNKNLSLSFSYFVSSLLVTGVSLFLNRKITFKGINRKHNKIINTVIFYYLLYITTAFIASLLTFYIQNYYSGFDTTYYKLFAIIINVVGNYLGLKFFIFKR
jgi:putative flippase GtrA